LLVRLASSDAMKKEIWKQEGIMWDRLFIGRKYKCGTDCLLGGNINVGQIVYWEEI